MDEVYLLCSPDQGTTIYVNVSILLHPTLLLKTFYSFKYNANLLVYSSFFFFNGKKMILELQRWLNC